MIFDELVLHNFGVYKGRQAVRLTPIGKDQPIVLIGGLNGEGKTTFLDALQLALYGRNARLSNRGNLTYREYPKKSITRDADPSEGAAVEIEFRHFTSNGEQKYRVHRSWTASGSGVKETIEVLRNDTLDLLATERWHE